MESALLLCMVLMATSSLAIKPAPPGCSKCTLAYGPVCKDGIIEYQNDCLARCQGVTDSKQGPCRNEATRAADAADAAATSVDKKRQAGYDSNGFATWKLMNKMAGKGYHLTAKAKFVLPRQDSLDAGRHVDRNKSRSSEQSPDSRRHSFVDFKTGFVFTKLVTDELPTAASIMMAPYFPGLAGQSAGNNPHHPNRRSALIISPDNRVEITWDAYPYQAAALLEDRQGDFIGRCSAALIAPQVAITAGHCVYDAANHAWYDLNSMVLTPGMRSGGVANFGTARVTQVVTYNGWVKRGKREWDIAVLYLDWAIGGPTGYYGVGYQCGNRNYNFETVHYPGDKPTQTMWWSYCSIEENLCDDENFDHRCDVAAGSSGAGMWTSDLIIRMVNACEYTSFWGTWWNCGPSVRPGTWSIIHEALATTGALR